MFYEKWVARKTDEGRRRQQEPTTHTAAAPTLGRTWLKQKRQIIASPNGREGSQEAPTQQKAFVEGVKKKHSLVLIFIQACGR